MDGYGASSGSLPDWLNCLLWEYNKATMKGSFVWTVWINEFEHINCMRTDNESVFWMSIKQMVIN